MTFRTIVALAMVALLSACAHAIAINPLETPARAEPTPSTKKVAYVMSDADRGSEVTTLGGGGDKVKYFAYRDLEKSIRDALRAVYSDVVAVKSGTDRAAVSATGADLVFVPSITTTSGSESMFTWPPTQFSIDFACKVTDATGAPVSSLKILGSGTAEFSEFKHDMGLAGRRAASDLSRKLREAVLADPKLQ